MSSEHGHPAQQDTPSSTPDQNGAGLDESGNVDRIRHILFGSQMRDYDARFQKLEERLAREASELRADVQKRLGALEAFAKGELESLLHRLKNESAERAQALDKAGRELTETARALEQKIQRFDEANAQSHTELRRQLLEQSQALSNEIKEKHDLLKAGSDQEAQAIRHAMAGRESLAEMLSEVALRLKGEFRVPGAAS
ncbi:MAG: hypothetical protein JO295_05120 [Verrucomicrobia bacterium]|nr:hypothetical protein [Verrucomicrobiota bacterium]